VEFCGRGSFWQAAAPVVWSGTAAVLLLSVFGGWQYGFVAADCAVLLVWSFALYCFLVFVFVSILLLLRVLDALIIFAIKKNNIFAAFRSR